MLTASYFLPAKAMQNNFRKFEGLVFCDLRCPDSGFQIPVSDSAFWVALSDMSVRKASEAHLINKAKTSVWHINKRDEARQ